MNDRELLELAAKAAGISFTWADGSDYDPVLDSGEVWNPLTDSDDALRLAVKLNLQVTPGCYRTDEATAYSAGHAEAHERVHCSQDLAQATRRAIVRAAAEIGRDMK